MRPLEADSTATGKLEMMAAEEIPLLASSAFKAAGPLDETLPALSSLRRHYVVHSTLPSDTARRDGV